ncbi:hypothetical protein PHSY_002512 [Pseudozyma hubeiensis SY62]|uniref:Uncharacterized protein n=1 Tax=Pseudozyma hubeiensis (strain SY62) TaxID=1305764 RepID=R9P1A5_PSEHS|nr:hypothetical protein PHSY_002512 [Pseudozyma hubeiensis SY62]GAC94939.1 hypothetical protein PHSY_002512 [Pseudozyma hubeiensis SY62]
MFRGPRLAAEGHSSSDEVEDMSAPGLVQQLRRWALTLTLGLVAALAVHLARVFPWYRLYLGKSPLWSLQQVALQPVSNEGLCFSPNSAALRTADAASTAPIGSYVTAGLDDGRCFHYASRFEPYLNHDWKNTYITKTQERLGLQDHTIVTNDLIWYSNLLAEHEPSAYPHIEWSKATRPSSCPTRKLSSSPSNASTRENKISRVAFLLRCYQGFDWTQDAVLHMRALIWELRTARLAFDVDVHLLLEVKEAASHVSMFSAAGRRQILRGSIPIEFWSMVTLWNESEMLLRYPLYGDLRAGIAAAGSYRGCLLAVQRFAVEHPEYDSVINWEMDTRFTDTYDHLLAAVQKYAFRHQAQTYTKWPVKDREEDASGIGEQCKDKTPDVVVFSPVRDPQDSGWYWEYDVQGYAGMESTTRAASVGTNLWLSRRALMALENVTATQHQSLFCEAIVPSLVFRSTALSLETSDDYCTEHFKLVHYPHPMAFQYQAPPDQLDRLLNPSSAKLAKHNEEALKDTSYYYTSTIAGQLYGRWQTETKACIKPLLLHPIKSPARSSEAPRRSSKILTGWLTGEGSLHLCYASADQQCSDTIRADVQRYLGRKLDRRNLAEPSAISSHDTQNDYRRSIDSEQELRPIWVQAPDPEHTSG